MTDPRESASYANRVLTAALIVSGFVAFAWLLGVAGRVLWLAFAGLLLAVVLRGAASLVARWTGLPDKLSLAVALAVVAIVSGATVAILVPIVLPQIDELTQRLPEAYAQLRSQLEQSEVGRRLLDLIPESGARDVRQVLTSSWFSEVTGIVSTALGGVADLFVIVVVGIFGAANPSHYSSGAARLFPPEHRERAHEVFVAIGGVLRHWFLGRIGSMTIVGITSAVALAIIGVPLAVTLGLLAGLLSFVPNLGPILAVVPPTLLAFLDGPLTAVAVVASFAGIQIAESYLITPLIQQKMVNLSPAILLLAQVVGGIVGGLLGLLLAAPLLAAIQVLIKKLWIERLERDDLEREQAEAAEPA